MNDREFGLKVRKLRESKKITREEMCGDEAELSVRQLARIEAGQSKPTLTKINFIADCLGTTLYELMPDYVTLPEEYLTLKYDILRTPTYGMDAKKNHRDEQITDIYERFYDDLPEEEQVAIDTIRSIFDVHDSENPIFGKEILEEYFMQMLHKEKLTVNEILFARLFLEHARFVDLKDNHEERETVLQLLEKLLRQEFYLGRADLFILRDTLFLLVSISGVNDFTDRLPLLLEAIESIMERTQDYQKLPVLKMISWKYALFVCNDLEKAAEYYEEATIAARFLGDVHLQDKLKEEWNKDRHERADDLHQVGC